MAVLSAVCNYPISSSLEKLFEISELFSSVLQRHQDQFVGGKGPAVLDDWLSSRTSAFVNRV